jgi:hypothetical protein
MPKAMISQPILRTGCAGDHTTAPYAVKREAEKTEESNHA